MECDSLIIEIDALYCYCDYVFLLILVTYCDEELMAFEVAEPVDPAGLATALRVIHF